MWHNKVGSFRQVKWIKGRKSEANSGSKENKSLRENVEVST